MSSSFLQRRVSRLGCTTAPILSTVAMWMASLESSLAPLILFCFCSLLLFLASSFYFFFSLFFLLLLLQLWKFAALCFFGLTLCNPETGPGHIHGEWTGWTSSGRKLTRAIPILPVWLKPQRVGEECFLSWPGRLRRGCARRLVWKDQRLTTNNRPTDDPKHGECPPFPSWLVTVPRGCLEILQ